MKTSIHPVLITVALACFALSPTARAVCQQGCLPFITVLGDDALINNTGILNTAIGFNALYSNTTGNYNTATGDGALRQNTTGSYNTATGVDALINNTTGYKNTANGLDAIFSNTTGFQNTATGGGALQATVTAVMLEVPSVATSSGPFGTVAGVQFSAVFQSLLTGLRFQVALSA